MIECDSITHALYWLPASIQSARDHALRQKTFRNRAVAFN
jgi:hypothetical protein